VRPEELERPLPRNYQPQEAAAVPERPPPHARRNTSGGTELPAAVGRGRLAPSSKGGQRKEIWAAKKVPSQLTGSVRHGSLVFRFLGQFLDLVYVLVNQNCEPDPSYQTILFPPGVLSTFLRNTGTCQAS
jgi:hypothetical protein